MMPVSITYLNQVNMATAWLRVRGLAMQISGPVLTNMVLYMLSFFLIPKGVLKRLDYFKSIKLSLDS